MTQAVISGEMPLGERHRKIDSFTENIEPTEAEQGKVADSEQLQNFRA